MGKTLVEGDAVNRSVLEAIESGEWSYEPDHSSAEFSATNAIPGSAEKLEILARRIQAGLPLWHPHDRQAIEPVSAAEERGEGEWTWVEPLSGEELFEADRD